MMIVTIPTCTGRVKSRATHFLKNFPFVKK